MAVIREFWDKEKSAEVHRHARILLCGFLDTTNVTLLTKGRRFPRSHYTCHKLTKALKFINTNLNLSAANVKLQGLAIDLLSMYKMAIF